MKKKIITLLIVLSMTVTLLPAFSACNKQNVLNIGNWADYIGEGVLTEFQKYYKEITGKEIKVNYEEISTTEDMFNKITINQQNLDLICPSDYIIEKLRKGNFLLKINKDLGNDINDKKIENYFGNYSKFTLNRKFDPTNEYSVGYMWGTLGIIYNEKKLKELNIPTDSWEMLWNKSLEGKITMKDSVRDIFAAGAMYNSIKALNEFKNSKDFTPEKYQLKIKEIINDTSDKHIAEVLKVLKTQFPLVHGYEVDQGKDTMSDGVTFAGLQWAGDALTSIAKNADLNYIVPKEGSNIFFDGWVIPKFAQNKRAAELFLNFISRPDIAIKNMDYIGYTSQLDTPEIIDYLNKNFADEKTMDLSYFFGEKGKNVHASQIMYPSKDELNRLAMMYDFGEDDKKLNNFLTQIKS